MLVGNVISVASLSTRFSAGSTGLYAQFLASLLESWETFLGPSGKVDVDGCSHASSKIGWAGVNITELLGQLEVLAGFSLDGVLYSLNTSGQSFENTLDITSLLHGNDSELILFIDPDKECFGFVVEDSTAFWPVTLHASYLQVWISRHEEEVIIDQLLSDSFIHSSQWIVVARKITSKLCESSLHELFHVNTLLLGDSRGQTESLDGSSNTDSDGVNWDIIGNVSLDFVDVHVGNMFESSGETVVFADEWVKDFSKVNVRIFITSVDTAMLVVEFNSDGNSLGQSESRGLGDNAGEFVPFFLGDVLSNQRVLGFDFWEFCHCNSFCFLWTD